MFLPQGWGQEEQILNLLYLQQGWIANSVSCKDTAELAKCPHWSPPSTETLGFLFLPSFFLRGLGILSSCLELLLLSALKDISGRIFALPGSLDFSKTPTEPTVPQKAQFQSSTLYFKPFFIPLFPFFLSLMLPWNKILCLEAASTFLQTFFFFFSQPCGELITSRAPVLTPASV